MVLLHEYSNSLSRDYNHDMVRLLACITVVTLYAEDPLALWPCLFPSLSLVNVHTIFGFIVIIIIIIIVIIIIIIKVAS